MHPVIGHKWAEDSSCSDPGEDGEVVPDPGVFAEESPPDPVAALHVTRHLRALDSDDDV